jgi:hypothetical protein
MNKNQINDRGNSSRVWECKALLWTNETRTLRNTSASNLEEAKRQFKMFTDFKEFITEPYIVQ